MALFLCILMLFTTLIPTYAFAKSSNDKGLQEAITTAKRIFSIPDDLTEFNYNVNTEGSKKIWYLNWNSKEGSEGSISIRIDDQGTVLSYHHYKYYNYEQKKFPKVSKKEAQLKAEEFIKKVNPDILSEVKLIDNTQNSLMSPTYYFNFIRTVNGIPFYENNIFIEVNRETGDVQNYYYNWADNLVFPDVKDAISLQEAQKAYQEKLGLQLTYKYTFDEETLKPYAAYTAKYNSNYCIDAITGEKINMTSVYRVPYGEYGDAAMKLKEESKAARPTLSPEELKAVEEVSKFLSQQKAEKIARDFKPLGLTKDFKLTSTSLSRDWPLKKDFTWHLYFTKDPKDKNNEYRYANIRIDAQTGEIKSFYINNLYKDGDTAKFDESASKAAVEKFLKEFKPVKFNDTKFDDSYQDYYQPYINPEKEKPLQYTFRYIRTVNGIPFPDNSLVVGFNAVTGKIICFEMNWFDLDFPSVDKAISLDNAYQTMFEQIGLQLQYKIQYTDELQYKMGPQYLDKPKEVKLVYTVNPDKPLILDAYTGSILDYSGKPYEEKNKPIEYTDITGHFAQEQITTLAEYGIALKGPEFKPDQQITQKDFFFLLTKTLNYYVLFTSEDDEKEIEQMYQFLKREGIIKEGEQSPTSAVTREDSVKFIIRALKYDKVADIKGIYNYPFKDIKALNPELIGYITIAHGLNIINGNNGYFNPKNELTRAEAAVMIYNYLQR